MPKKPQKFTKAKVKDKSPSNNRNIPAQNNLLSFVPRVRKEWRLVLFSFVAGVLVMVTTFVSIDSYRLYSQLQLEREKKGELLDSLRKWEQIVTKYPDYRDGNYTLALLYYQVSDQVRSLYHLERSLQIDPNFQKAIELREEIKQRN